MPYRLLAVFNQGAINSCVLCVICHMRSPSSHAEGGVASTECTPGVLYHGLSQNVQRSSVRGCPPQTPLGHRLGWSTCMGATCTRITLLQRWRHLR